MNLDDRAVDGEAHEEEGVNPDHYVPADGHSQVRDGDNRVERQCFHAQGFQSKHSGARSDVHKGDIWKDDIQKDDVQKDVREDHHHNRRGYDGFDVPILYMYTYVLF